MQENPISLACEWKVIAEIEAGIGRLPGRALSGSEFPISWEFSSRQSSRKLHFILKVIGCYHFKNQFIWSKQEAEITQCGELTHSPYPTCRTFSYDFPSILPILTKSEVKRDWTRMLESPLIYFCWIKYTPLIAKVNLKSLQDFQFHDEVPWWRQF